MKNSEENIFNYRGKIDRWCEISHMEVIFYILKVFPSIRKNYLEVKRKRQNVP